MTGGWGIFFHQRQYWAPSPSIIPIKSQVPNLDKVKGEELSFTDPDTNILVHTFTDNFAQRLFSVFHSPKLKIPNWTVCVTLEQSGTLHVLYLALLISNII